MPGLTIAQAKLAGSVLAVLLVVSAVFGAGWTARGWRADAQISKIQVLQADHARDQAEAALADLTTATQTIRSAADRYGAVQIDLAGRIDRLKKDLKNEVPLPVDCVADVSRLRKLKAGVDSANKPAFGKPFGPAVP